MSDDRHTFSDPRPVTGRELPTWEVDVFREGVPDPVFTLTIDNNTLPPRMRKRKVVWKLPDSVEQLPNFGADEKRRLLELFKLEKKSRRKSKRGSIVGHEGCDNGNEQDIEGPQEASESDVNESPKPQWAIHAPSQSELEEGAGSDRLLAVENGIEQQNGLLYDGTAAITESAAPPETAREDRLPHPSINGHPGFENGHDNTEEGGLNQQTSLPPPGFDMAHLSLNESVPEPTRRCFTVPPSSTNIPADLGKVMIDIYYPCITGGLTDELACYYVPHAQKSLSVGGAHAVCTSLDECLVQLQSLHEFRWEVRGVVAQPGVSDSVVFLVTGVVLPRMSQAPMSFCHTLTLVRVDGGYQIHNDAIALLTDKW